MHDGDGLGQPSPSRSPEAFFFTTGFAVPQSSGKSADAGSGAGTGTPATALEWVFGTVWAAVAASGCRKAEPATTAASAAAVAIQWTGRAMVCASSGTAGCCTRKCLL
ncbi:hypothetical protein SALBM135S_07437 [Streptomyces alboniger]